MIIKCKEKCEYELIGDWAIDDDGMYEFAYWECKKCDSTKEYHVDEN